MVRSFTDDDVLDETPQVPTTPSGLPSVYDQLRNELTKPANTPKTITLKVPARDGISVRFDTSLPLEKLDRWRKAAARKSKKDEIDILLFNQIIIASQCEAIIFNGEEVKDDQGQTLTFRSKNVQEMLNSLTPYAAIETLYDRDADILRTGAEITKAAGYDDEDVDTENLDDESDPLA